MARKTSVFFVRNNDQQASANALPSVFGASNARQCNVRGAKIGAERLSECMSYVVSSWSSQQNMVVGYINRLCRMSLDERTGSVLGEKSLAPPEQELVAPLYSSLFSCKFVGVFLC